MLAVGVLVRGLVSTAVLVLWLVASPSWAYESPDWLYSVEVPVAAQSAEERELAASAGLLQLLTRVTGLVSIPRNAAVREALAEPGRYYDQFVFFERRQRRGVQTFVRLSYSQAAVNSLLKDAELPIWGARRPKVVAWIAVDVNGRRIVLNREVEHPLADAFKDYAKQRGLPVVLPAMDEEDRFEISADDVWRRAESSVRAASARYSADVILLGRIRNQDGQLVADWRFWQGDQTQAVSVPRSVGDIEQVVQPGLSRLAGDLSSRFAVLPRALRRHSLQVYGLDTVTQYSDFMRFVASMEFVDHVSVDSVHHEHFNISLDSRAEPNQLLMLLTSEGRLTPFQLPAGVPLSSGLGVKLKWQG